MATDASKFVASGIKVKPGDPIPVRKEIRSLSDAELFVYVEGLALYQKASRDDRADPLSYYQIAGIHGQPYMGWPDWKTWGDMPTRDLQGNDFGGFCTHSSIIFLTWHRPYLALFESALYKYVQQAAQSADGNDPLKAEYLTAAKNFRMPYWDWALPHDKGSMFPKIALRNNSLPKKFKWKAAAEYNPLYTYRFPDPTKKPDLLPAEQKAWGAITQGFGRTVRHTDRQDMEDVLQTFFDQGNTDASAGRNLTERIAYLLQGYRRFASFSNNRWDGGPDPTGGANKFGSIEDVHNSLHGTLGGGGQMGYPSTSAFDPIFWLHHTNIDRLGAIWQGLWQDDKVSETWVTKRRTNSPNIVKKDNNEEDAKTPLYPFRDGTSWYDSWTMRQTKDFGYYYPETANTTFPLNDGEKDALWAKISALYPGAPTLFTMSQKGLDIAEQAILPKAEIVKSAETATVTSTETATVKSTETETVKSAETESVTAVASRKLKDLILPGNQYFEWLVNIKAEKHALGGDYSVLVFLGPPDDTQPGLWHLSPLYVGMFYPFGQDTDTGCEKCQDAQRDHLNVTGQIPLTIALMERYLVNIIPDMQRQTVVDYLSANLHWRVRKNGAKVDNRSDVDGLKVFVVTNKVTLPENANQLPVYEDDVEPVLEITTKLDGSGGRGEGTGLTRAEVPGTA